MGVFVLCPWSEFAELEIRISLNGNSEETFQFINTETSSVQCHEVTAAKTF